MNQYAKFGKLVDLHSARHRGVRTLEPSPVPRSAYNLLTAVNAALYDEMYYAEGTQDNLVRQVAYEPIARFAAKHLCCSTCPFYMPCGHVKTDEKCDDYDCYKYLCNNLMVEPLNRKIYQAKEDADDGNDEQN